MPVPLQVKSPHPTLSTWLHATGSLTQQLTQLGQGQFSVQPIAEHCQRISLKDSQWMGVSPRHCAWVREAFLYGSEKEAWVKAKSIFPIKTIQGKARIFRFLGKRPIGFFLFQRTSPECQRRVMYLDEGWTRQSCYTWHGCKFIVQETFLPAFENFLQKQTH
ncbi:MAG: chorismate lyase [Acinetobacter sp.]